MKKAFISILILCSAVSAIAQQYETAVAPLKGENGGVVWLRWVATCLLLQQQNGTI